MSGHLFILSQKQVTGPVAETKKIPVSAKQWEAGAKEIKANEFIFVGVVKKGAPVTLWLTAKATTRAVKTANGGEVRLSFIRIKTVESAYPLAEGIATGYSLKEQNWKKLDEQETLACFFDTEINRKVSLSLKNALSRTIPKGIGIDGDSVLRSVLINGNIGCQGPVLRGWYDAELLVNEPKYREVLRKRLSELDGVAFEDLLAQFFRHPSFGFSDVRTTQKSHDGGIDLELRRNDDVLGHMLIVVQCKRQIKPVGGSEVGALASARERNKAGKALFITTSHFSEQAKAVAAQHGHLELIDGDQLANLFFRHAEKVPGLWGLIRHSVQKSMD